MKKVLIVDDDEEICQELAQIIKDEGYDTRAVYNGIAAKDELASKKFDLVLLDLKIPGINGLDLLKMIKREKENPCVLVLSARPMRRLMKEKAAWGSNKEGEDEEDEIFSLADGFINKPFNVELLLDKIKELTA
ncbi:MAG: response regulator transcription factor [Deltaproteobacteria bacterium]